MASKLESLFAAQLRAVPGLYIDEEDPFAESIGRKWRADFRVSRAPDKMIGMLPPSFHESVFERSVLVDIQGIGPQGRHGSWGHIESDAEKFSTAAALGWRVLIVTGKMVKSGLALDLTLAALGLKAIPVKERTPRRKSLVPRSSRKTGKELPERVKAAMRRAQA